MRTAQSKFEDLDNQSGSTPDRGGLRTRVQVLAAIAQVDVISLDYARRVAPPGPSSVECLTALPSRTTNAMRLGRWANDVRSRLAIERNQTAGRAA
jgi:hypothetical protein